MLILLPPSEGKADPPAGPAADLAALAFAAELGQMRERVIRAVDPSLAEAPAAPAIDVYAGVLFAHLDFASLPAAARRGAGDRMLIASGMWGLLRPADRIPRYKLPIGAKVKRMKSLAAAWRAPVAKALAEADTEGELIVDCRSGAYSSVWKPRHAARVEIKAFREEPDGARKPISHMAKASRGLAARALLAEKRTPGTVEDLAGALRASGLEVEIEERTQGIHVIERPRKSPGGL